MSQCVFCDKHFKLCHNGKSSSFLTKCQKQNKSCDCFLERQNAKKDKATKQINEIDWTDEAEMHYVHVYWGRSSCFINKHRRTEYRAKVYDYYEEEYLRLRVFYCHDCEMFYANGNLLPERDVMHHLRRTYFANMPSSYYEYFSLNPRSVLSKYGYSVRENGPTTSERQRILVKVIEEEALTPYGIINHIGNLIDWHYWDSKWKNAIRKWQEDLEFVKDYQAKDYPGRLAIRNKR